MKAVQYLLFAFGSLYMFSVVQGQQSSVYLEGYLPQAGSKFKCPAIFGVFPDPDDCSHFYMCMGGAGIRIKCKFFLSFDMELKRCVPSIFAKCGNDKTKSTISTTSVTVTKSVTDSTSDGGYFICSSFMGSFPHPNDCSKYYSCLWYIPTVKTCPQKKLFDAVKKSCKPEGQVHCGTRERPPGYSTTGLPGETTTISTMKEQISTENIVSETTEAIIPTEVQPTGPPDHSCSDDDLDCIITDTGDISNWFQCPENVGSYPHPSSDMLFIFCMNWIPSAKKCGVDLIFSKELLTCINIKYFM